MMGIWAPDVHRISVPSALINLAVAFTGLGAILVSAAYMAPSSPVVSRLKIDFHKDVRIDSLSSYSKKKKKFNSLIRFLGPSRSMGWLENLAGLVKV
jgi:hypothetical protein